VIHACNFTPQRAVFFNLLLIMQFSDEEDEPTASALPTPSPVKKNKAGKVSVF